MATLADDIADFIEDLASEQGHDISIKEVRWYGHNPLQMIIYSTFGIDFDAIAYETEDAFGVRIEVSHHSDTIGATFFVYV